MSEVKTHTGERHGPRQEKIHALTSLRFFAAFWVVLYHSLWSEARGMHHGFLAGRILSLGFISVTFFFLLSGYILAMVYLQSGKPLRKKSFFAARFARIYPLFLCTLLADTPHFFWLLHFRESMSKAMAETAAVFSADLFMLQAWSPHFRYIDFPNWSLSVETVFYLIFPLVGVLLWRLRGVSLWATAIVLWAGSQALIYWLTPRIGDYTASYNPILHVPTFLLGILLARWQVLHREEHKGSSHPSSLAIGSAFAFLLIAMAATILYLPRLPHENLNHGLLAPIFIVTIWLFSNDGSLPTRLMGMKWLVILGEASFGLYLIHIPVLYLYQSLHWIEVPALYATYLVVCIGLSLFSFYRIETPSRKWILKRLQTRPKETMEAASDAQ